MMKAIYHIVLCITFQATACLAQEYKHIRRGSESSAGSSSSSSINIVKTNNNNKQRVVLIAGPHKTGSSSIQDNMYNWMTNSTTSTSFESNDNIINSDEYRAIHQAFKQWAWPEPKDVYDHSEQQTFTHAKIFYPFGEALHGCKMHHRKELNEKFGCEGLLKVYRDEFSKYWKLGYNLVIGTEAFDTVGGDDEPLLVDDLLDQMPWNHNSNIHRGDIQGHNEDITIVIKYRSPRVMHLMSWWHQCCMKKVNFYQFLIAEMEKYSDRGSRIIDSLQLAERFLDKGLNVVLIDVSGVIDKGYDLSYVIACDVMNVPCTKDKVIEGSNQVPSVKNQKSGGDMGRITERQIEAINNVIRKRDCSFQHLAWHPKLTILYPLDITRNLMECKNEPGITRKQMNKQILDIVIKGVPEFEDLE